MQWLRDEKCPRFTCYGGLPSTEEELAALLENKTGTHSCCFWLQFLDSQLPDEKKQCVFNQILQTESELRQFNSSLAEIFFFDWIYEKFVWKVWVEEDAQADDNVRKKQLRRSRSLKVIIRQLSKLEREFAPNSNSGNAVNLPSDPLVECITCAKECLEHFLLSIRPRYSTNRVLRRAQLADKYRKQHFLGERAFDIYRDPELVPSILVVATEILSLRGMPKKVIYIVLAQVMPALFPKVLFQNQAYPIPSTPSAIQKSVSRAQRRSLASLASSAS